jgi:hypothetical protein
MVRVCEGIVIGLLLAYVGPEPVFAAVKAIIEFVQQLS